MTAITASIANIQIRNQQIVNPEVSPRPNLCNKIFIVKTIAVGVSTFLIFGPVVASVVTVANIAFRFIARNADETTWFKKERAWEDIKSNFRWIPPMALLTALTGAYIKMKGPVVTQLVMKRLVESTTEPFNCITLLFRICVLGPILEEIVFRGFLQEKIHTIQSAVWKGDQNSTIQKITRVVAQAVIFGLCHFHPAQGISNLTVVAATTFSGYYFGGDKERTNDLWSSVTLHMITNILVSLRVLVVGG